MTLRPMLTMELTIEGVPTKAMIHTGSPVTVALVLFLLETLARQHPAKQSLEQWKTSVNERLESPQSAHRTMGVEDSTSSARLL